MNLTTIPSITCGKCNETFEISRNRIIKDNYNITCPKCHTKMDEQMAHKVASAIGEVEDVNMEFKKFDKDEPYFQLGIKNALPTNIYFA